MFGSKDSIVSDVDFREPGPAAPVRPKPLLELHNVSQAYGHHQVVKRLSFDIAPGRIVCLLGPSGCGKTTVLRTIAGFEPVAEGEIVYDGQVISRKGWRMPPEQRRIGMVFQDYALFPHLTVAENVLFGLHRLDKAERGRRADELLRTMGLAGVASKYPHELSGGQQQRVALARALAPRPGLLLLDEPFSNLDVELRERLGHEVRDILKEHGVTAIMVTHHQYEAFAMGDEVGVMLDGEIQQWDTPYNLYHRPANRFVAGFIGEGVWLPGTVLNSRQVEIEAGILAGDCDYPKGKAVDVLLRPDDVVFDETSVYQAEVANKAFRGADILYTLRLASGGKVLSLVPSHFDHPLGARIGIRLAADHVVCFARP